MASVHRPKRPRVEPGYVNRLVMNYLVVEGHRDAAAHFHRESGTEPNVDIQTIEERNEIRHCIERGDVEAALIRLNATCPEVGGSAR